MYCVSGSTNARLYCSQQILSLAIVSTYIYFLLARQDCRFIIDLASSSSSVMVDDIDASSGFTELSFSSFDIEEGFDHIEVPST